MKHAKHTIRLQRNTPKRKQAPASEPAKKEEAQKAPLMFIQPKLNISQAGNTDTGTNEQNGKTPFVQTNDVSADIEKNMDKGATMDTQTKTFMESRFGADFSGVQIHTGKESAALNRELEAKAFTVDNNIFFNEGEYNPQSDSGKHLLAHELTHTLQQRSHTMVQRQPAPKKKFKFGNIALNTKAASDLTSKNVLLDSEDQKHLSTANNMLGYDENYTTPEDAYRWQKIKELVDDGTQLIINAVSNFDKIPFDIWDEKSQNRIPDDDQTLYSLGGTGITLPVKDMEIASYNKLLDQYKQMNNGTAPAEKKDFWEKRLFQVSRDPAKSMVYYESDARGRASNGRNSLAHELFGHFWLAKNGMPHVHGTTIKGVEQPSLVSDIGTQHNVTDALGGVYKGSVSKYISSNLDSNEYRFKSPTWKVGLDHLNTATGWLASAAAKEIATMNTSGTMTSDFINNWYVLNNNYNVGKMTVGNAAVAELVMRKVFQFYCGLDETGQVTFRKAMGGFIPALGSGSHPKELAKDVMDKIINDKDHCNLTLNIPQKPANLPAEAAFENRPVDEEGNFFNTLK